MNEQAFENICYICETRGIEYKVLTHEVCRTSAESAAARAAAGFTNCVGAKAILMRMTFRDDSSEFNIFVLPAPARLDSRALKSQMPGIKKFRFASQEELFDLCGVLPGALPPFGNVVFPRINHLYVDEKLRGIETIAFNVAALERSLIMQAADYLKIAKPTGILKFADSNE